jgi:hypothetical protein
LQQVLGTRQAFPETTSGPKTTPKEVVEFYEINWKMCGLGGICRKRKSSVANLPEFLA